MSTQFKDYGDQARHLWKVGYQMLDEFNGVAGLTEEVTFLRYETKEGIHQAVFGSAGLTIGCALRSLGLPHKQWIRVGSLVVLFRECDTKAVRDFLIDQFGERGQWWALQVTRSSAAAAIRGYRRRRDALLRTEPALACETKGGA